VNLNQVNRKSWELGCRLALAFREPISGGNSDGELEIEVYTEQKGEIP
jgi:hypothetical protein